MMLPAEMRKFRVLIVALAAVFLTGSFSGCTALRRKFVRKNKTEDTKDRIVPVLQPEEYAPRIYKPIERYREHYSILKGYFGDLWNTLGRDEGGKREKFLISQIEVKIDLMADLLQDEKSNGLKALSAKVKRVAKQLDNALSMRRYDIVSSDLRTVERDIRRHFKPELIEKNLK